jgi:hypothetical protein
MITQPKTKTKFVTVQDYLDCDNRASTGQWIKSQCPKQRIEQYKKQSMSLKKKWANPEQRKKLVMTHKKKWSNPEFKAKMLAQRSTPEYKKMISEKRWGINYVRKTKNYARKKKPTHTPFLCG